MNYSFELFNCRPTSNSLFLSPFFFWPVEKRKKKVGKDDASAVAAAFKAAEDAADGPSYIVVPKR